MENKKKRIKKKIRILQSEIEELQRAIYLREEGKPTLLYVFSYFKENKEDVTVVLSKSDIKLLVKKRRKKIHKMKRKIEQLRDGHIR